MRNWDPLSVFKYVNGSPSIHLTFFILLFSYYPLFHEIGKTRDLYINESNSAPFATFKQKNDLIKI